MLCRDWFAIASAQIDEQRIDGDPGGSLAAWAELCGGWRSRREVVVALTAPKPGASSVCPDLALALAGQTRLE
jgi:hypothetical protein